MNKREFLDALDTRLSGFPRGDTEERISFYAEMIDDRVEAGLSEEEAVAELGTVDAVFTEILADTSLTRIVKQKLTPKRRLTAWEIVLLAVGAPIWASLLISVFAVAFSLYASLWALLISAFAVFASFVGGALGGAVLGLNIMESKVMKMLLNGNVYSNKQLLVQLLLLAKML